MFGVGGDNEDSLSCHVAEEGAIDHAQTLQALVSHVKELFLKFYCVYRRRVKFISADFLGSLSPS